MTTYWVRVRFTATGHEQLWTWDDALARGLFLIGVRLYADVLAQGETTVHEASPAAR